MFYCEDCKKIYYDGVKKMHIKHKVQRLGVIGDNPLITKYMDGDASVDVTKLTAEELAEVKTKLRKLKL